MSRPAQDSAPARDAEFRAEPAELPPPASLPPRLPPAAPPARPEAPPQLSPPRAQSPVSPPPFAPRPAQEERAAAPPPPAPDQAQGASSAPPSPAPAPVQPRQAPPFPASGSGPADAQAIWERALARIANDSSMTRSDKRWTRFAIPVGVEAKAFRFKFGADADGNIITWITKASKDKAARWISEELGRPVSLHFEMEGSHAPASAPPPPNEPPPSAPPPRAAPPFRVPPPSSARPSAPAPPQPAPTPKAPFPATPPRKPEAPPAPREASPPAAAGVEEEPDVYDSGFADAGYDAYLDAGPPAVFDDEQISEALKRIENVDQRLKRVLAEDGSLRAAVDLAMKLFNGEIARIDGRDLNPGRK